MAIWLDIAAAIFAFGAAIFWFLSAYGSLPRGINYIESGELTDRRRNRSAKMNGYAASLSGLSALCMGLRLFF
jgi:hypothetical protein